MHIMGKLAVTACVLLATASLFAAEHTHQWGQWVHDDGEKTHSSQCLVCGERKTVACYTVSATVGGVKKNVCLFCGDSADGTFPAVEATAKPVVSNAKVQRGDLAVRGLKNPFPEDKSIRYAFTVGYCNEGALASFKNRSAVTFQLPAEIPDSFELVRVSTSSGDDSTSASERWNVLDHTCKDGMLSFETKFSALYCVIVR